MPPLPVDPVARAFVAVEIPESLRESISGQLPHMSGMRMLEVSAMHITLAFLGNVESKDLGALKASFSKVRMYPFEVSFSGIGMLVSHDHAVLYVGIDRGSDALSTLAAAVREACRPAGVYVEQRLFLPHMTIGRIKDAAARGPEVKRIAGSFSGREFGSFACNSFWLVSSVLTASGPIYTRLFEVRLHGWQ